MSLTASVRMGLALLVLGTLNACASDSNGDVDCGSRPKPPVATASTWEGLNAAMLDYTGRGHVGSVRTQARGERARDALNGDQQVRRVVDLLDQRGRFLVRVDIRRTGPKRWRADIASECTD
jgi:hypothetical protein